jgi:hypothetical protein
MLELFEKREHQKRKKRKMLESLVATRKKFNPSLALI